MTKPSPADVPAAAGGTPVRDRPLPFYRAAVDESDIAAVGEALRSGWLTSGPRAVEFENRVRDYCAVGNAVAVSSCSEAMFLALKALGVGPGDEVITSPITFASTVHAILHTGATPVLADIERETSCVDPDAVRAQVGERTRVLLPVHFGGQACRIEEIVALAARHGIDVVEDAAHSFGAKVAGRLLGGFGRATAFSFYATKNLTTAEGGAITTDDDELARQLRLLGYHGMSRDSWSRYSDRGSWYYEVELPGYKCNLSDLHAALGLAQLARIDDLLARRRAIAGALSAALAPCDAIELPRERPGNWHTWHLYVIQLRTAALRIGRDEFIKALRAENVGSSVHFIPVHRHPFFRPYLPRDASFPVSDDYYSRCVSLPIFPDMTADDVRDVADAVTRITAFYRAG
ncbi:MAG TPA: DegT/DnrJ/EryC1/StrS family aminotransferase [Candidatus Krumholzibacteria bacterium]|nr:DegT/DnrJ/EryC1/StrS family aminotransferase [Candidatus Krumholzibacteria bacterium]